jgi:hypothetical protein
MDPSWEMISHKISPELIHIHNIVNLDRISHQFPQFDNLKNVFQLDMSMDFSLIGEFFTPCLSSTLLCGPTTMLPMND